MTQRQPFALVYDPDVARHMRAIEKKHHSLIHNTIEQQLQFVPENETLNRKPLEQPAPVDATWELRCGPNNRFRVLYSVDQQRQEVQVLAIGVKVRNRLMVGGEEVEL